MATAASPLKQVKALFFDVFGTCTDWRPCITRSLSDAAAAAAAANKIPRSTAAAATKTDWAAFAAEWRDAYMAHCVSTAADDAKPLVNVDTFHREALASLLAAHDLSTLFDDKELDRLALRWHFLDAWPDVPEGIRLLNAAGYATVTLSNGNVELLAEMAAHAGFEWTRVVSADMFGSFKPNPRVYRGAAAEMGLRTEQCALVASHLPDLKAAKACGFRTIYTARPREEAWSDEQVAEARRDGWVDIWVDVGDGEAVGGEFPKVARQLRELKDAL